jgi:hypothetical protein
MRRFPGVNGARTDIIDRIADRIDLAIDLLTLGQYGLEQAPASAAGCEGGGAGRRREALPPARRRGPGRSARRPVVPQVGC